MPFPTPFPTLFPMLFPTRAAACAALLAAPLAALAQLYPPPQNVVNLNASASVELTKDVLTIVFGTSRDGADAAAVQSQLKQAVDAALAEARKAARPGQLEVHSGNFALFPRYAPKGGINGWQGSAEVVVEGKDVAAISQLAGRMASMTVSRVAFSLSREAREQVETDVAGQAVARFRAKAEALTKQFGFGGYSIREVSVNTESPGGAPVPLRASFAKAAGDEALPVEAGKATVTATVSGSVTMSPK